MWLSLQSCLRAFWHYHPYFILQLFFILVLFSASHGLEPKLFAQLAHSNPSKHALCTLSFCVGGVGTRLVKMGSVSWSSSSTCTAIENYTDNGPNVHIDALYAVFTEKFLPGLPHVAKVSECQNNGGLIQVPTQTNTSLILHVRTSLHMSAQ